MRKIFLLIIIFVTFFPLSTTASENVKAGFIRDGDLWIINNGMEKQITSTGKVSDPLKWSADGKWLMYQNTAPSEVTKNEQQLEIWAYEVESGNKKKVFYDGGSPTWAPHKNVIAFLAHGILDISDLEHFYHIPKEDSLFKLA